MSAELMTRTEAASALVVSVTTIDGWAHRGLLVPQSRRPAMYLAAEVHAFVPPSKRRGKTGDASNVSKPGSRRQALARQATSIGCRVCPNTINALAESERDPYCCASCCRADHGALAANEETGMEMAA